MLCYCLTYCCGVKTLAIEQCVVAVGIYNRGRRFSDGYPTPTPHPHPPHTPPTPYPPRTRTKRAVKRGMAAAHEGPFSCDKRVHSMVALLRLANNACLTHGDKNISNFGNSVPMVRSRSSRRSAHLHVLHLRASRSAYRARLRTWAATPYLNSTVAGATHALLHARLPALPQRAANIAVCCLPRWASILHAPSRARRGRRTATYRYDNIDWTTQATSTADLPLSRFDITCRVLLNNAASSGCALTRAAHIAQRDNGRAPPGWCGQWAFCAMPAVHFRQPVGSLFP